MTTSADHIVYHTFDDHELFKSVLADWFDNHDNIRAKVQFDAKYQQQPGLYCLNPGFTTWVTIRSTLDLNEVIDSAQNSMTSYMAYDFIDKQYAIKWQVGISDLMANHRTLYISFTARDIAHDLEEEE